MPVKQFLKNRRTGVPPVFIGEAGQEENFRCITFPCEAKILEKTRAKTQNRKVFERFLNKSSAPLRLRENLLKKTSRLGGFARKKRSREEPPPPRERALSFKHSYLRRRRDTTSANAPTPAINPNADGSGIAIPLEINASVSDLIFPRNATSPRYFFVSYFS